MAPAEGPELVAPLVGQLHEGGPHIVRGERMGLEGTGGVLGGDLSDADSYLLRGAGGRFTRHCH
jgi:hypothetical protein